MDIKPGITIQSKGPLRAVRMLPLLLLVVTFRISAQDPIYPHVQVATPFIELFTGPGRGYPIFFVAKKGEWVDVLKRHTDWFKVRTVKGKTGWVHRTQMETTVTELGTVSVFRDNLLKDFFGRRLEMGFEGGTFNRDPLMLMHLGYKLNQNMSSEISFAQVSGAFSSFRFVQLNITHMPWHDTRIAPYFSIGAGTFNNVPRGSLVSAIETDALAANAAAGLRFYITRNFVFRGEYRYYNAMIDDNLSQRYTAWAGGISFFF